LLRLNQLLIFSLGALTTSCHWGGHSKDNTTEVNVLKPIIKNEPLKLKYIGITKSIQKVEIRARVDGILEERYFKDGDTVSQDQLLYRIDEKPYQAQVLTYQGQVDKATADLAYQDLQYQRYGELVAKKAISKSQYDQQYANYLSAKGQLENAQGSLQQAQINLDYCRIKSPSNGKVGKNQVDLGNLVSSSNKTLLLTVIQMDPMRVEFNPVASDLAVFNHYSKYQPFPVEISLPKYPSETWRGVLDFYNNEITQSSSTILLRTTVLNPKNTLRPDLYVDVTVTVDPTHPYLLAPSNLVKEIQGLYQLRVVDAKQLLQVRNVIPGIIKGELLEIKTGLLQGDQILLENPQLPPGTKVKPIVVKKDYLS